MKLRQKHQFSFKQGFKFCLVGMAAFLSIATSLKAHAINLSSNRDRSVAESPILIAQSRSQRIQFQKGSTQAVVSDGVVRGTRNTYLLRANKGQTMRVLITSVESNARFDVIAPNGKTLVEDTGEWSGSLPANGDYKILVGSTRGNATFNMEVSIN